MFLRRPRLVVSRLPAAALCALATHTLVYRTLRPSDGAHGYFTWYEPVIAAVSAAAAAGLLLFVLVAWLARRHHHPFRRAPIGESRSLPDAARRLGCSALLFLLAQESLERTAEAGRPAVAALTPSQWLVLLLGIAVTSLLFASAVHVARRAARRVLGSRDPGRRVVHGDASGWSVVALRPLRPRPLAERFGRRAPPVVLG